MLRYFFISLLSLGMSQSGFSASVEEEIRPLVAAGRMYRLPYGQLSVVVSTSDSIKGSDIYENGKLAYENKGNFSFSILQEKEEIGKATFEFWPNYRRQGPILYLRLIVMGKNTAYRGSDEADSQYRQKGYGTEALETIWTVLCQKDAEVHLTEHTLVKIEIEKERPWLLGWYKKFGFRETEGSVDYFHMQVPLSEVRFPLAEASAVRS